MKLLIDRGQNIHGIYSWSFGPDWDIMINKWNIPFCDDQTMATVDELVTNSPNLIFCVTHIKHPFLIDGDSIGDGLTNTQRSIINDVAEITFKQQLREYFATRLQHRRHEVILYDFGKRLFS